MNQAWSILAEVKTALEYLTTIFAAFAPQSLRPLR
jgi:hypothetical protein